VEKHIFSQKNFYGKIKKSKMQYILIFSISVALLILMLFEPWLILALSPFGVYLLNILVALVLTFATTLLIRKIKQVKSEREVVYLTAHQLSAPLSSTKWALQMILNNDFGEIKDEQRTIITKAYEKNEQLIYIVDDLLDTYKIEAKKYLLSKKPCDIESIVTSVLEHYKHEIAKKKIELNFAAPSEKLPMIMIDKEKIALAVQNLFDNAIKYTPVGGKINVTLQKKGEHLMFKIQDSGIGIEKKQAAKIFSKFFRGSNAFRQDPMGYGLGLFFVKNIIEAHNGKIWFESKENVGTSFYFTLPVKRV